MADNVTLPGTGVVVAADDVSGVQYQKVKLINGTADDATAIPGGAAGLLVQGQAAADAAVAGNPLLLGAKALAIGQATTDVNADADAVALLATRGGRLYVCNAHPNRWQAQHSETTAQTNHEIKAAPAGSLKLMLTDILISNGAVAGEVKLLDGSGGTVLLHVYLAPYGGGFFQFHTPIILTAATALCLTSVTVTTHTLTVSGFTSA